MKKTEAGEKLATFNNPDAPPMWIFDQRTLAFLAVNRAATEVYGYSIQEFLSMTILDIRPAEDVTAIVKKTLDPTLRGPSNQEQWRHKSKDGQVFLVQITSWELTYQGKQAELVQVITSVKRRSEGLHGTSSNTANTSHSRC